MQHFNDNLLRHLTPCNHGPLPEVCKVIAQIHAEFLLIHPFREGNGRMARWIADILALQAGYPLPFYLFHGRGSKAVRELYLHAVIEGYLLRYHELALFFEDAIRRRL